LLVASSPWPTIPLLVILHRAVLGLAVAFWYHLDSFIVVLDSKISRKENE
jgi:hypothetical protein